MKIWFGLITCCCVRSAWITSTFIPSYTSSWKSSRARSIDWTKINTGGKKPWKEILWGYDDRDDFSLWCVWRNSGSLFLFCYEVRELLIQITEVRSSLTCFIRFLMARSFPFSEPTNSSCCSTVSTAEFLWTETIRYAFNSTLLVSFQHVVIYWCILSYRCLYKLPTKID